MIPRNADRLTSGRRAATTARRVDALIACLSGADSGIPPAGRREPGQERPPSHEPAIPMGHGGGGAANSRADEFPRANICGPCWRASSAYDPALQAWARLAGERAERRRHDATRKPRAAAGAVPLHGVPIAIKDNLDTAGLETNGGTDCWPAIYRPRMRTRSKGFALPARSFWQDRDDGFRGHGSSPDPQSVERRTHAGRIEQWLGCGCCRADVRRGAWLADRRLGPPAGRLLRRRRPKADI